VEGGEFAGRCRDLAPTLATHAGEGEALRRVPDAVLAAVREADLLRILVPRSLGGHGGSLADLCEGTRELARGDVASAWTVSFLMVHSWFLARFPATWRDGLFAEDPAPTAAAPLAPTGTLTPVDGGYRVDGRWAWATAVHHSDWVIVHGIDTGVELATRFAVVPVADVTVEDVWHTSGMRATGSDTVVVEDLVVPADQTLAGADLFEPGRGVADDHLVALPLIPVLSLTASAPALGAAEAAVAAYQERLADRVLAYSLGERAAEQPVAQVRLGAALGELDALLGAWRTTIARLEAAPNGDGVDDRLRVRTRLGAAGAVQGARRLVADIGVGAGASVYLADHPFQRIQRDIETMKGHAIFDPDRVTELAGRVALGAPLGPTDLA